MSYYSIRDLPLPAQCAMEYLDCQAERSIAKLDAYLAHYHKVYGIEVDAKTREAAHYIAQRRFSMTSEEAAGAVISVDGKKALDIRAMLTSELSDFVPSTSKIVAISIRNDSSTLGYARHIVGFFEPFESLLLCTLKKGQGDFDKKLLLGLSAEQAYAVLQPSCV